MAREKHWSKIEPLPFIANGGSEGEILVSDTCGLYVKQNIILQSNTDERVDLEIKRVLSRTEIKVGRKGHKIDDFVNISSFLVSDTATIRADEQNIGHVPPEVIMQAKWAHEPINADRNALVDCYGDYYTKINPLPVEATIVFSELQTPIIVNTLLITVNTEVPILFPGNVKEILIKVRTPQAAKLQYSWVLGDSGTTFITIKPGNSECFKGLESQVTPRILYIQASKGNTMLEVQYWI